MFIRQLEYLVALSQLQHFSRAAQHCNVSQPSLSNAIKQLEEELGTPIVLRHQRFQGFTAEGMRVVEWSKRIIADRNAMLQELSVLRRNLSGELHLGAMPTCSPILPFISEQFSKRHPGVRVQISFLGLEEMRIKLSISTSTWASPTPTKKSPRRWRATPSIASISRCSYRRRVASPRSKA